MSAAPSLGFVLDPEILNALDQLPGYERWKNIGTFKHVLISPLGDVKAIYTHGLICFDKHGRPVEPPKEGV